MPIADRSPHTTPLSAVSTKAKSQTHTSMLMRVSAGNATRTPLVGTAVLRVASMPYPTMTPQSPPTPATSKCSVKIWRMR